MHVLQRSNNHTCFLQLHFTQTTTHSSRMNSRAIFVAHSHSQPQYLQRTQFATTMVLVSSRHAQIRTSNCLNGHFTWFCHDSTLHRKCACSQGPLGAPLVTFQQATFPTGMFNLFFHRHVTCAFYKTVVLANVHTHVLHTQRLSGHMVRDKTW